MVLERPSILAVLVKLSVMLGMKLNTVIYLTVYGLELKVSYKQHLALVRSL